MKKLSIISFFAIASFAAQLFAADMKQTEDGKNLELGDDGTVMIIEANGEKTPATDGKYTLTDGSIIVIEEGKVVPASSAEPASK